MNESHPTPSTNARIRSTPPVHGRDQMAAVETGVIRIDPLTEPRRRAAEALTTVADAEFGIRGLPAGRDSVSWPATFAAGLYTTDDLPTLLRGPICTAIHLEPVDGWDEKVEYDLEAGIVRHVLRHKDRRDAVEVARFLSAADGGVGVQAVHGPRDAVIPTDPLHPARDDDSMVVTFARGIEIVVARDALSGDGVVAAAHDDVREADDERTVTRYVGLAAALENPPHASAMDRLAHARRLGVDELEQRHRRAWTARWSTCGTWLPERPGLERATRFATFHLLSCGSTATSTTDETAIGARGLTGTAYRGHVFWDTDAFVVPALSAIAPDGARRALTYRWNRLDAARRRAGDEGRQGARFPWESARNGTDVTPRSGCDLSGREVAIRTGELEEHITADISWAVANHFDWTGDEEFMRQRGLDILIETARYWASRVEVDDDGTGHIRNVIGPDEYHEDIDDNVFTNVMARHNLDRGADLADQFGGCGDGETRSWREIAERLFDGYDSATGLYEQFAGYHTLSDIAAASVAEPPYSADVLIGRAATAGSRLIKQPDVLMAYHLVPGRMRPSAFGANCEYYIRYTAHGSSLSPAVMASLCFRARRWDEGLELFELACQLDLDDMTGTTAGGLHLATMGGLWQAVTFGLLGMRAVRTGLVLDPRVPPGLGPVRHRVAFRGAVVTVDVDGDEAIVRSTDALTLRVGDEIRRGGHHRLRATSTGEWEHR